MSIQYIMSTHKTKNTSKRFNTKRTFTKRDYESGNGMLTDIWGACQWHVLHTMSFNYPMHPTNENKQHYRMYVNNLVNVLPCGKCRKNLTRNLEKLPLKECHMASRNTFSRYIYELHEVVNDMLHKHSGLTYEQVRERYEQFRSRCTLTPDSVTISANKPEPGCTEPLVGEKQKCVLHIVPKTKRCNIFKIDRKCIKKRQTIRSL